MKQRKQEAAFQRSVIDFAHLHGWKVAHFPKSMSPRGRWMTSVAADAKGFPDLLMVRKTTKDRLVSELKCPPNTVTEEQDEWLTLMEICGIPAFVWTPNDWVEISLILERGTSTPIPTDSQNTG